MTIMQLKLLCHPSLERGRTSAAEGIPTLYAQYTLYLQMMAFPESVSDTSGGAFTALGSLIVVCNQRPHDVSLQPRNSMLIPCSFVP